MKKKILTFAFALISLCAAAQIAPTGLVANDPVDYSRLRLPTDEPALPAFFTMEFGKKDTHTQLMAMYGEEGMSDMFATDKITALGSLVHTWNITPEYVEECIQKALNSTRLTRAEIARIYKDTPLFHEYTYTNGQWANDMFGFVTGVVGMAVPMGEMAEMIYGVTTSATSIVASNVAGSATTADNAMNIAGMWTAAEAGEISGAIGTGLSAFSMFNTVMQQYDRDQMKWVNRTYLTNMARLDLFYAFVNFYLRSGVSNKESVWVLAVPQINKIVPYEFRGVMCKATWSFNLGAINLQSLPRKVGDVPQYGFEGEYFGFFNAAVNFDLSKYDKNYLTKQTTGDMLGANGGSESPLVNAMSREKGIIDTDRIRSDANLYRAFPDQYSVLVKNEPTMMDVTYRSPIHITVEVPVDKNQRVFEHTPEYFWDVFENEHTQVDMNMSGVMRAMGISVGSRNAEVKPRVVLSKGYSATEKITRKQFSLREFTTPDSYYCVSKEGNKPEQEYKVPLENMLVGENVPAKVPEGTLRLLWTSEIKPPVYSPRKTTEEEWSVLFKKYGLHYNL